MSLSVNKRTLIRTVLNQIAAPERPKDPFFEVVFAYGFPGSSRKTWSCSGEITIFGPKERLPRVNDSSDAAAAPFFAILPIGRPCNVPGRIPLPAFGPSSVDI
jgi:hypothetical protein